MDSQSKDSVRISLSSLACSWFWGLLGMEIWLGQSVLKGTLSRVMTDLTGIKNCWWSLLGVDSISPYPFFFSNIGSYFIGVLDLVSTLWLVPGLFMMLLPLLELSLDPSGKTGTEKTGTLHQERRKRRLVKKLKKQPEFRENKKNRMRCRFLP